MSDRSCFYCTTRFSATFTRRLFCSEICQTRYNREAGRKCFYCSELASDRDHLYPHSASTLADRAFAHKEVVFACSECNRTIGNNAGLWLETRIEYLIKKFTKRYKLNQGLPDWDSDEMEELGHSLRSHIEGRTIARQRAEIRLANMKDRLRQIYATDHWEPRKKRARRGLSSRLNNGSGNVHDGLAFAGLSLVPD